MYSVCLGLVSSFDRDRFDDSWTNCRALSFLTMRSKSENDKERIEGPVIHT